MELKKYLQKVIYTTVPVLLFTLIATVANANDTTTVVSKESSFIGSPLIILFSIFIVIELIIIGYLIFSPNTSYEVDSATGIPKRRRTLWERFNNFKAMEEESSIELDHDYDGIKELDNAAPPWFTIGFTLSIIFAFIYMYRYHVVHSAPLQIEEYTIAVEKAKEEKAALDKLKPPKVVDENNLVLLSPAEIAKGKEIFIKNCATCHANDGGGGAGPNLTDNYWLHGGSLKDIFISVKTGYPQKGMPGWGEILGLEQVEQVTSYIKTLKGTKPAIPKEQQGELYNEN